LSNIKLLGCYGGDVKDINEWQGVFWPYKKARPVRSGLCVASGVVSSRLAAVRPGYITENKLFHPTRVCFVLDCKWCFLQRTSKGVKG